MTTGEFSFESIKLFARMMRLERFQIADQRLIAARFAGLPLQRADLAFDLADDIGHAQQIRLRRFQLSQRFAFLRLVFGDAGRFLENCAPIFRPRAQYHVNFALLHHGVSCARDAGIGEETLYVT